MGMVYIHDIPGVLLLMVVLIFISDHANGGGSTSLITPETVYIYIYIL